MTRTEIHTKIRDVLVDALAVDEGDVVPTARLTKDLGAESIDFLDIVFKLEQAFDIKIAQGELFPENMAQDSRYVLNGKFTETGLETLRTRMPHVDFAGFEKDPQLIKVAELFTVDALVKFIEKKLAGV